MRLTKQTNYAIRILMYCAVNDRGLSKAGLVQTVRGRNGGLRMGRDANQITLFDVIKATEDSFSMADCFDKSDGECVLINNCSLNSALHDALNAFFDALKVYTIADLVSTRPQIGGLLGVKASTLLEPFRVTPH